MTTRSNDNSHPRICLLTDSFYPIVGGGEVHARQLSAELIKRKVAVIVLTRRRLKENPGRETVDGVEVVRVMPYGFQRFGKYLMIMPVIIRLFIMRKRYDIIYVCGLRILGVVGVLAAKSFGKKSIVRSESCGEMSGDFIYTNLKRDEHRWLSKLFDKLIAVRNKVMLGADRFLAISDVIKVEYTRSGVDENKIENIPNGIDTDKFCSVSEDEKAGIRKILQMPDKLIFVYTGKLNKGKGLALLLVVWKKIIEQHDSVHLYLVGSGSFQALGCEKELRSFVSENSLEKCVTFTGYVENVHEYLQAADYFVIPSESESQCLSLIEAMSCGLPSIATAVGGILDIIEDGVNGQLVHVGNGGLLQEKIMKFIRNPEEAEELGIKGRATVSEKYGIDMDVNEHVKLFQRLYLANF